MAEVERDEYGLDPTTDWSVVEPCADDAHIWGPWVLSRVFGRRRRPCTRCGVMEIQYLAEGPG